jgi:hypothetical protein
MWESELSIDLVQRVAELYAGKKLRALRVPPSTTEGGPLATRRLQGVVRAVTVHLGANLRELDLRGVLQVQGHHSRPRPPPPPPNAFCTNTNAPPFALQVDDEVVGTLALRMRALRTLNISEIPHLTDGALRFLGRSARTLRSLDVGGSVLMTDMGVLALLGVRQAVKGPNGIRTQVLEPAPALGHSLEGLGMRRCRQISDIGLHALSHCHTLRTLDVAECGSFSDDGLTAVLGNNTHLEEFLCCSCPRVTDVSIRALLEVRVVYGFKPTGGFTSLARLDLSHLLDLTDITMSWVAAACPALRELLLSHCPQVGGEKGLAAVGLMKHLAKLSLLGCELVTDEGIHALCHGPASAPRGKEARIPLADADLRGCLGITDSGINALADACKGLHTLALGGAPGVSDVSLKRLWQRRGEGMKKLVLDRMNAVSAGTAKGVGKYCRFLTHLEVTECPKVTDQAMESFKLLRNVEVADFSRCAALTDAGVGDIPCWKLRRLILRELPQVTDDGVRGLMFNAADCDDDKSVRIQELDLAGCPRVTGALLQALTVPREHPKSRVARRRRRDEAKASGLPPPDELEGFAGPAALRAAQIEARKNGLFDSVGIGWHLRAINVAGCPGVSAAAVQQAVAERNAANAQGLPDPPSSGYAVASEPYYEAVLRPDDSVEQARRAGHIHYRPGVDGPGEFQSGLAHCGRLSYGPFVGGTAGFVGLRQSCAGSVAKYQDDACKLAQVDVIHCAVFCQSQFRGNRARRLRDMKEGDRYALMQWTAAHLQAHHRGRHVRKTIKVHRKRLTTAAVKLQWAWRRYYRRKRISMAGRCFFKRLMVKVVREWRSATVRGARARAIRQAEKRMAVAAHHFKCHHLKRSWPPWVQWITEHKLKKSKMAKAVQFWWNGVRGPLFGRWKGAVKAAVARRRRVAVVFQTVAGLHTHNSALQLLHVQCAARRDDARKVRTTWAKLAENRRLCIEQWDAAARHDGRVFLLTVGVGVWNGWVKYTTMRLVKREFQQRADAHLFAVNAHRGIRIWRWHAQEAAYMKMCYAAAVRMWQMGLEHKCCDGWIAYYRERLAHKARIERARVAFVMSCERKALNSWLEFANEKQYFKDLTTRASEFWHGASLKAHFTGWRLVVADMSDSKAALLARQLLRVQKQAFNGLRFVVRQSKERRRDQNQQWVVAKKAAAKLQSQWRGKMGREKADAWKWFRAWAVITLQSLARRWLAKQEFNRRMRHVRMFSLAYVEDEQAIMYEENMAATAMRLEWDSATTIKAFMGGHKQRMMNLLLRQMKAKEDGLLFKLHQQDARDEAARREAAREARRKLELQKIEFLQRVYRGHLGRCAFAAAKLLDLKNRNATRIQAFVRGRKGRKNAWAILRLRYTRGVVESRRLALGKFLRFVGFKHRHAQRPVLKALYELGLDPDSYNFSKREVALEVKDDFKSLMRDMRVELEAWFSPATGINWDSWQREKVRLHYQREKEEQNAPQRGDVVRIVIRDDDEVGETAFVLKVDFDNPGQSQAEVRMDDSGVIRYVPLVQEATDMEARMSAFFIAQTRGRPITDPVKVRENRLMLLNEAEILGLKRRRYLYATCIQQAYRAHAARVRVFAMRDAYRALVASRQAKLYRQLTAMGLVSGRVGRILKTTRMVKADFIPDMPEKPLLPPGVVDAIREMTLYWVRRLEAEKRMDKRQAFLENERTVKRKRVMRWRKMWVPRKVGAYVASQLMARTTGAVADVFHAQAQTFDPRSLCHVANEAVANFVGGPEWRRTYEDRNAWVAMTKLDHLHGSPHVVEDGWVMYHGVWGPPGVTPVINQWDDAGSYKPHGEGTAELIKGRIQIYEHPSDCICTDGGKFTLAIHAEGGEEPYHYQWFHKPIGALEFKLIDTKAAGKNSYTQDPVTDEMQGEYYCEVFEMHKKERERRILESARVVVQVNPALACVLDPEDQILTHGGKFTLEIAVEGGTPPYTYQWQRDQGHGDIDLITESKAPIFHLNPASEFDGGQYTCTISDRGGMVIVSNYSTIIVHKALLVKEQPFVGPMTAGDPFLLHLEMQGGTLPLHYQWYKDGEEVTSPAILQAREEKAEAEANGTLDLLGNLLMEEEPNRFFEEVSSVEDAGRYWCVVSDSGGVQTICEPVFVNIYGPLHVTVVQARNVMAIEWMQSSPYVTITVNTEEHKTRTVERTLNPVYSRWDRMTGESVVSEHYEFNVTDMNNTVQFYMEHNKNLGANEFMGKCELPVLDMKDGEERRVWLELLNQKNKEEIKNGDNKRGQLEVILRWEKPPALHVEELLVVEKVVDDMITCIETTFTCMICLGELVEKVWEENLPDDMKKKTEFVYHDTPRSSMPRYSSVTGCFFDGAVDAEPDNTLITFHNHDRYKGPYVGEDQLDANGRTMAGSRRNNHWGSWMTADGFVFSGALVDNHWDRAYMTGEYEIVYPPKADFPNFDTKYKTYVGDVVDQCRHGHGQAVYRSEAWYEGEWQADMRWGYGEFHTPDGSGYVGTWANDLAHGNGVFSWSSGAQYAGDFYEGKRHGQGGYRMANGDRYLGNFFRNKFHGEGSLTYASGAQYDGPFRYGQKWGKGVYTDAHGAKHIGSFVNDKLEGEVYVERPLKGGGVEFQKGMWDDDEFTDWITYPVNPAQTEQFVMRFKLNEDEYDQQYALIIARTLPLLPHGIDPEDSRVKAIVGRIQREGGSLVGYQTEQDVLKKLQLERPLLEAAEAAYQAELKTLIKVRDKQEAEKLKVAEKLEVYDRVKKSLDKMVGTISAYWQDDEVRRARPLRRRPPVRPPARPPARLPACLPTLRHRLPLGFAP